MRQYVNKKQILDDIFASDATSTKEAEVIFRQDINNNN